MISDGLASRRINAIRWAYFTGMGIARPAARS